MNNVPKEAIEFLSEAKKQFEIHPEYTTYRDSDDKFIALRNKVSGDITVYHLGDGVGNFESLLPKQIDYHSLWERLGHEVMLLTIDEMNEIAEGNAPENAKNPYNEIAMLMYKLERESS